MNLSSRINLIVLFVILFLLIGVELDAQCPMCRMAADSNLKHGGTEGKGLNTGILYMLAMPYLLVATFAVLWYRNKKEVDPSESTSA